MNFEIPKEIKARPKLFGLEIKELIILIIGSFLILTMLGDMVHRLFIIPFYIVSAIGLFWMVMPSKGNPDMKNYMGVMLYMKHNKATYHALDVEKMVNDTTFREGEGINDD